MTKVTVNLAKWGNSMAVRIPKVVLDELNIGEDNLSEVRFEVAVDKGRLVLSKKQELTKFEMMAKKAKGQTLEVVETVDWGEPVGEEVW